MDKLKTVKDNILAKIKGFFAVYITQGPAQTKQSSHQRLNFAAKGLGFGVMGFFFGRAELFFSANPFGTALLSACGIHTPFVYIGLLTSTLFSVGMAIPNFLMYSLGIILRFIICCFLDDKKRTPLFAEAVGYRVFTAATMQFMLGLYRCIAGGFLWYDLFGTVLGMAAAPLLCAAYCSVFIKRYNFTVYHDIGLALIMASCVYSLKGYSILGFSPACVLAFGVALYTAKECGMLKGGVAGLAAGLAYDMIYAPLFSLAAIVYGLAGRLGTKGSVVSALLVGVLYGIYADGFSSLVALAPDLLCACLIFMPLASFNILPAPLLFCGTAARSNNHADTLAVAQKKEESSAARIKAMSEAMSSLSKTFYRLSDRQRRPRLNSIKKDCEGCFERHCKKCDRQKLCWEDEYSDTANALGRLSTEIYKGARADIRLLPQYMLDRCELAEEIISDINCLYSKRLEQSIKSDKAEVFAIDYAAMSALLEEAIAENQKDYAIDDTLTARLKNEAVYLNFASSNLAVFGNRRKQITAGGVDLARVRLGVEELRRSFERVVGAPLTCPEFTVEKGYVTMNMRSSRIISCETAYATAKKQDEVVNGDSISFFENSQDYSYALLGDGMGSGRDAALTSGLATIYLDRLLRAGNKKEISLAMLNQFLRQKGFECFTTIDLLEVDMLLGEACFVKSGAAPSYIIRGTSLFKIASGTMPVGITRELRAEEVKFKLKPGDIIVMASDGIAQSFEEGIWLVELLCDWDQKRALNELAQSILDKASLINCDRDDMTVGVVKVTGKA